MFLTQYRLPLQDQAKWARQCLNEQTDQSAAAAVPVPHTAYAGTDLNTLDQTQGKTDFIFCHLKTSSLHCVSLKLLTYSEARKSSLTRDEFEMIKAYFVETNTTIH